MNRFAFLFLVLSLFALGACSGGDLRASSGDAPVSASGLQRNQLTIETAGGPITFDVELATTLEEQRIGLMYRESLPANAGMLFDYTDEPKNAGMWMKNTLIPLDMAFIDSDGVIVRIAENTTPRSLDSIRAGQIVAAVLEVNGGQFSARGVSVGDRVRHPIFE